MRPGRLMIDDLLTGYATQLGLEDWSFGEHGVAHLRFPDQRSLSVEENGTDVLVYGAVALAQLTPDCLPQLLQASWNAADMLAPLGTAGILDGDEGPRLLLVTRHDAGAFGSAGLADACDAVLRQLPQGSGCVP